MGAIYGNLCVLEQKCIQVTKEPDSLLPGGARPAKSAPLTTKQLRALIALHRMLLNEHHDLYLAAQHPATPAKLRKLRTTTAEAGDAAIGVDDLELDLLAKLDQSISNLRSKWKAMGVYFVLIMVIALLGFRRVDDHHVLPMIHVTLILLFNLSKCRPLSLKSEIEYYLGEQEVGRRLTGGNGALL